MGARQQPPALRVPAGVRADSGQGQCAGHCGRGQVLGEGFRDRAMSRPGHLAAALAGRGPPAAGLGSTGGRLYDSARSRQVV